MTRAIRVFLGDEQRLLGTLRYNREGGRDALWSAAPYFQVTLSRAREILSEVERAVNRWRECG